MKLSNLLIGIIILGLIVTGTSLFFAEISTTYNVNETDISKAENFSNTYNHLDSLSSDIDGYTDDVNADQDSKDDLLGSIFGSAYTNAQTFKKSLTTYSVIAKDATNEVSILGKFGNILNSSLGLIIIIVIALLFLSFIIKYNTVIG